MQAAGDQDRTKAGAILIAVGMIISLIGFLIFNLGVDNRDIASAQDAATRAALYVKDQRGFEITGWLSIPADIALIVGGLLMTWDSRWVLPRIPVSAFWVLIVVAAFIFLALDVTYATAFAGVAGAQEHEPGLYRAMEGVLNALFTISVQTLCVGFLGVFVAQIQSASPAVPHWIATVGVVGCALSFVGAFGPVLHIDFLTLLEGFSLIVFLPAILLGFRLATGHRS